MATRKPANGSSDKKFFDVAKPGKSMPPSTSRPAIVGHRTILKDPMVNTGVVTSNDVIPPPETPVTDKVVSTTAPTLKPLNVSVKADSDSVPETEKSAAKPADTEPEADPVVEVAPEAEPEEAEAPADVIPIKKTGGETVITPPEHPEDEKPAEAADESSEEQATDEQEPEEETKPNEAADSEPASSPAPSETQPAGSAEATAEAEAVVAKSEAEKQAEKASEAAAARLAATERLIADKTYFVPVGERRSQRSKKHVGLTLFLCFIALLALGYLAIDSGMIKTSIDLPVRLFRVE